MTAREEIIGGLTARFCQAHGCAPDSDELICALADAVAECGRNMSTGFMRWPPARPVRPPKPQRPSISDDEPETPHG